MHDRFARMIDAFSPAEGPPPRRLMAFFRWCLAGSWGGLAVAALTSALSGAAEVASAALLGRVVDAVSASGGAATTTAAAGIAAETAAQTAADAAATLASAPGAIPWALAAGFALFFLVIRPAIMGLSTATSNVIIGPNVLPLVLSRLHRWTMGQAVTFFDNDFAGRIAQKQMQTARAVTDVASEMVNTAAFALSAVLGSALYLAGVDAWAGLMLVCWLVAYGLLIRYFIPRVRAQSAARASARAMITGQVVDTITNIKTVKLFASAGHEDRAALGAMETFRDRALDFGRLNTWFRLALTLAAGVLPVVLVGGSVLMWHHGRATPGDVAAAGAIGMRLAQMTGWVSMSLMSIWGSIGEVEDGMATLAPPHALTDAPDAVTLGRVEGHIDYDGVSFAYGRGEGGIEALDLHIRPGERIGIVGASGAGKSTLVALLLRLYDVERGKVRVDGRDVRAVTQESLRRNIGMVTQETAMFNRSARDNIRYGSPDATEAQVIAAAKAAEAHDFILGLRDFAGRSGYDAHLGERGVKLSGGQRQRIALARAFLKDAPILVLDEATSALDSEVEAAIQEALSRVMQGKTVLAIAHRLSTIAEMDRIVVMQAGRIVEEGSHAGLLALNGVYARYWNRQSGGFLGGLEDEATEGEGMEDGAPRDGGARDGGARDGGLVLSGPSLSRPSLSETAAPVPATPVPSPSVPSPSVPSPTVPPHSGPAHSGLMPSVPSPSVSSPTVAPHSGLMPSVPSPSVPVDSGLSPSGAVASGPAPSVPAPSGPSPSVPSPSVPAHSVPAHSGPTPSVQTASSVLTPSGSPSGPQSSQSPGARSLPEAVPPIGAAAGPGKGSAE